MDIQTKSSDIKTENNIKAEDLQLKTVSGKIELNQVESFQKAQIKSTSGDIKLAGKAKEITIKTTSGEIELGKIESEKAQIKNTSGNIEIKSITNEVAITNTSGEIKIVYIKGKLQAKSISGNIQIRDYHITGDSELNTVSGEITTYFNKVANCQINTKTTSGDIHLPEGRNVVGIEPYHNLKIKTTSGNIKIHVLKEVE